MNEVRTPIEQILHERHGTYGNFVDNAKVAQAIKAAVRACPNWLALGDDGQEAMDQFASKMSRLLTGNATHLDSWDDIAGYATLVADRLRGKVR